MRESPMHRTEKRSALHQPSHRAAPAIAPHCTGHRTALRGKGAAGRDRHTKMPRCGWSGTNRSRQEGRT